MTLWNEEIRRCGVVDNAEKVSRAKQSLGVSKHIQRDKGKPVGDIVE